MDRDIGAKHGIISIRAGRWLVVALAATLFIAGCAQIRKATYPKDFVYLENRQIISEMALMSFNMRQIEKALLDETAISSEQQAQIIMLLAAIDASAEKLGAGSVRTNHLVLDDHIDDFRLDVAQALRDASSDPPNYYALGKLAGSCVACHRYR